MVIDSLLALVAPIKLTDCLNSGKTPRNTFEVIEGGKLTSTCIADGKPLPYLQCFLLKKDETIVQMTRRARGNFAASNPIVFNGLNRHIARISCVLDSGTSSDRKTVYRKVIVYCKCLLVLNSFLLWSHK